jgi:uncharacterized membrane protein YkoI
MKNIGKFSILLGALTVVASAAYAARSGGENDALAISNAKIPLTQAVSAAEQHVGGKAARAEYENTRQGWAYDVEVIKGSQVFDVRVDADKGTVISSTEDKADRDDHDERD